MVTNIDQQAINFCTYWECGGDPNNPKWLKAYKDSGGLPTIGVGCIQYPNGQKVKLGDTITPKQKDEYFAFESRNKVNKVIVLTRDDINQFQFNAIFDICFNIGTKSLQTSTLLKVLNKNLNDRAIVKQFCAWRFDNGDFVPGLLRRRMSAAYLYFTGKVKTDWVNYKKYSIDTINEVLSAIDKTISH